MAKPLLFPVLSEDLSQFRGPSSEAAGFGQDLPTSITFGHRHMQDSSPTLGFRRLRCNKVQFTYSGIFWDGSITYGGYSEMLVDDKRKAGEDLCNCA
ncbi:Uncharacterized protein M6B38_248115 [Iris pallida]|uniref:Uncharacterized protein n=1 Tax=Iris pallida TaxID=29817 RepID=A0AAX6DGC9_IRIPA|nr:Uncharacterized protein M6B38_248115 [Iris pallida]